MSAVAAVQGSSAASPPKGESAALRLARKAWRSQYVDSQQSAAWALEALTRAGADDHAARGWGGLAHAFHHLRHASPEESLAGFDRAQRIFDSLGDRRGLVLTRMGISRCWWVQGRVAKALALVLALRDEGLDVLRREERGMLLNGIAGCYSSQGESAQAFAYMYQALRESSGTRDHGFDVVLYNNLAHELFQLGDCDGALGYLKEGVERCQRLVNPRLMGTLLTNRVACLTDLDRAPEALADIHAVLAIPDHSVGQGSQTVAHETMALAALRAGERALGAELIAKARELEDMHRQPEARILLRVAETEHALAQHGAQAAMACLQRPIALPGEGVSWYAQGIWLQTLANVHEHLGDTSEALVRMRQWQQLHLRRAQRASQARYQAASLQTELMRVRQERDRLDARQRASERARRELEAINAQLSQKIQQVQQLQAELEQQAVRDVLTGLFNRRHLNEVLRSMHAMAQRDASPLAVVVIDLDHFKAVNDSHGHSAGDTVLRAFGELLRRRMRRSDVACRFGGEEFCLLLPRTGDQAARRKVQALLKEWRAMVFSFRGEQLTQRTFSAGAVDSVTLAHLSAEQLIDAADDCAYAAKRAGRNRVALHVAPDAPSMAEAGAVSGAL